MTPTQLVMFPVPEPVKPVPIVKEIVMVAPPVYISDSEVLTYWENQHTGTCQQRHGATLWTTTSLWVQITKGEYDRWVFNRRMMWTWPKDEQIKAQDETIVIIGV